MSPGWLPRARSIGFSLVPVAQRQIGLSAVFVEIEVFFVQCKGVVKSDNRFFWQAGLKPGISGARQIVSPVFQLAAIRGVGKRLELQCAFFKIFKRDECGGLAFACAGTIALIKPAQAHLISRFRIDRANATTEDGAWKFPDADAYYAMRLNAMTTTPMTASEIHDRSTTRRTSSLVTPSTKPKA